MSQSPLQKVDPQDVLDRMDKEMCERSLHAFVKRAWKEVEPGQPMIDNWHLPFICEHLEAITDGAQVDGKPYNRLLINIPPGGMKSLLLNVFWPAWEWGPANLPHMRYLCASHNIESGRARQHSHAPPGHHPMVSKALGRPPSS